nr:MAG TPA: hypothetical protein [Caudoviricetes sp.]
MSLYIHFKLMSILKVNFFYLYSCFWLINLL